MAPESNSPDYYCVVFDHHGNHITVIFFIDNRKNKYKNIIRFHDLTIYGVH